MSRNKFTFEEKVQIFNETRKGTNVTEITKLLGSQSVQSIYQARRSSWYVEWDRIMPKGQLISIPGIGINVEQND